MHSSKTANWLFGSLTQSGVLMAEIQPPPLIPARFFSPFLLHILSIVPLHFPWAFILSLTPCLLSAFVPPTCVSQLERLAAMAVMQNTFQMNTGLPQ